MDTAQWPQEIVVKSMEEILPNSTTTTCSKQQQSSSSLERKMRPPKEQTLNCPRCNSTNTKFCYYNNYSLSQPRYFCKTCRRYWTEGGSLRNIPVGGGSRKNKRSSSSSSSSSASTTTPSSSSISSKKLPDLTMPPSLATTQNPNKIHQDGPTQDLNLGFSADFKTITELIQVPNFHNNENCSSSSALELLTGIAPRGLNSFLPMTIASADPAAAAMFSPNSGFASLPEFKPSSLSFSLDGLGIGGSGGSDSGGYGSLQESSGGRVLFPFEDLKQASSNDHAEQNRDHHQQNNGGDSTGYWSGVLGGGGGW